MERMDVMSIIDHNYYLNPHIYKWISQLAISACCIYVYGAETNVCLHYELECMGKLKYSHIYIYNLCESLVRMNVALEPTTRVIVLSDTKQFYKL